MKTLSLSWQNPVRISCQLCQQTSVPWAFLHLSGISSDPRCHWTLLGLVSGISTYQADGFLLCLWLTLSVTFLKVQMTERKASQSNRKGCVLGPYATQRRLLLLGEGGQGHSIEEKKKKKDTWPSYPSVSFPSAEREEEREWFKGRAYLSSTLPMSYCHPAKIWASVSLSPNCI